jgi:hypothetical protein
MVPDLKEQTYFSLTLTAIIIFFSWLKQISDLENKIFAEKL